MNQKTEQLCQFDYSPLYRCGGLAAVLAALLFRRNLDAEYYLLRAAGIFPSGPTTAPQEIGDWFELLLAQPFLGLTLLNLFDVANILLVGMLFLALYAALWQGSPSLALISVSLTVYSVSTYLVSNQAFNLLALSRRYATAAADSQLALLQTGQTLLAVHHNNSFAPPGIHPGFLFISLAGLLLAIAMLHSPAFTRSCAAAGILANAIGLSYYLFLAAAPGLTFVPMSLSAIFLLAWYLMSGLRLLRLSEHPVAR